MTERAIKNKTNKLEISERIAPPFLTDNSLEQRLDIDIALRFEFQTRRRFPRLYQNTNVISTRTLSNRNELYSDRDKCQIRLLICFKQ